MHWLLWHSAEVNKQTQNEDWTPAHIASIRGRDACIQVWIYVIALTLPTPHIPKKCIETKI